MAGLMAVWDFMKYAIAMGSNVIWNLLKNGMTLQWRVITIFLYLEMALVLLILLFSIRWNAILESQLVKWLDQILKLKIGKTKFKFSYVAFAVFLIFVATRFIGAAWDAIKFSFAMNNSADMRSNPQKEIELLASLYRAQRNFFISGVALFLLLLGKLCHESLTPAWHEVLHRLNSNLNKQSKHEEVHTDQHSGDSSYARMKCDYEQLRSKMESTNNEYDRLMKEHATLQRKIKEMEVPFEDKKEK